MRLVGVLIGPLRGATYNCIGGYQKEGEGEGEKRGKQIGPESHTGAAGLGKRGERDNINRIDKSPKESGGG